LSKGIDGLEKLLKALSLLAVVNILTGSAAGLYAAEMNWPYFRFYNMGCVVLNVSGASCMALICIIDLVHVLLFGTFLLYYFNSAYKWIDRSYSAWYYS
jgi:hypothetical protein